MARDGYIIFVFLGLGILLLGVAVVWHQRLAAKDVINLDSSALGIKLKANAFGAVLLAGLLFAAVPAYFMFQAYDAQIEQLKESDLEKQGRLAALEATLRQLKGYDLGLNLSFADPTEVNPFDARVTQYVRRRGESADRIYDPVNTPTKGAGGIVVYYDALTAGDRLYVVAEYGGRQWRSEDVIIPSAQLIMHAVGH